MRQVLEDLPKFLQGESAVEVEYRKLFNEADFRCGNVLSEDEKITIYIHGVLETIRTVVARSRERIYSSELTFEGLAHFAKSEDKA